MSRGRKANQAGRSKGAQHHVRIYCWMIKLPAWKALSGNAAKLYIEMSSLYYGENNGEIFMSVRSAATRLGVSPNTADKAIKELEDKGFIRPLVKGSFHRKVRHATTWVLTEHEFNGYPGTKPFARWRPKENTALENGGSCIQKEDRTRSLPQDLNQTVSDIETELRDRHQVSDLNADTQISYQGERDETPN